MIKTLLLKINAWLHLWLGLVSGLIVIILSITGCVLVFETDIKEAIYPYMTVDERRADEQAPPSMLYQKVKEQYPDREIASLWYYGLDKSVKATIDHSDTLLYLNPYTGEILAEVDHEDIFHIMDEGHRNLWLGYEIGRPIVGWATFLFFLITLSGVVLWWPKRWKSRHLKQAFSINWKNSWKRINYDLHNVLGFYSLTLALLMAVTGLIMSFPWMRQSAMWLAGGLPPRPKIEQVDKPEPLEKIELTDALVAADKIWHKVRKEIATVNKEAVIVHFAEADEETIYACTDMYTGRWRDLSFDRNTLELLPRTQKELKDANTAEWISRSNYALHTGFIGGFGTKLMYFTASLICASLPITGFYVWWGKRRKSKNKTSKRRKAVANVISE